MKKANAIAMLLILIVLVSGCGGGSSDKYYSDTPLKNFETFTSITGIEVSGTEETEGGAGRIYTYIFNNDADGMSAMLKYETYIKEYGFVEGESNGSGMTFYNKDDKYDILISMSQPQESVIQYMVIVPHMTIQEQEAAREEAQTKADEDMAKAQEEEYPQFVELCKAGKYEEAKEFFNESSLYYNDAEGYRRHYLDSQDYWNYCNGMLYYANGEYGRAVDEFSNCETSVLDLDKVKTEILNEISFLNGTYQITDTTAGYKAISIIDGRVGTEIEASSWPTESGHRSFIVKTSDGSLGIGGYSGTEYIFSDTSGSSLTLKKAPGASYDTFAGKYKQTSTSPLKEK